MRNTFQCIVASIAISGSRKNDDCFYCGAFNNVRFYLGTSDIIRIADTRCADDAGRKIEGIYMVELEDKLISKNSILQKLYDRLENGEDLLPMTLADFIRLIKDEPGAKEE